ncbi:MAG: alpha/beta hydrolase fold domain-containing protein [Flavobacteriales bacterium]|nr:alpha/beta hydrolase fold domain-containing protein [Flavobacteriales bacterium]
MKTFHQLILILFLFVFSNANAQYCASDERYTEAVYFDIAEITVQNDVAYGQALDHLGVNTTLLMDVYYPSLTIDASPLRPFVLLMHGGGFSSGDKQLGDIRDLCYHLAMRGFACASINYRLGYDFTEYGQYKARYRSIQDANAAMRFVVANANSVRIDPNWLFVGGQSAGSLTAHGMIYADESECDNISVLYNATSISTELGGLYNSGNNLTDTYTIKGLFNNWGAVAGNEVETLEMVPTIAFHGGLDNTVLIDTDNSFANYSLFGSETMHDQLLAANICSELTVDILGGHGIYRNASSVFRAERASCFFKSIFCNSCSDFYATDSIPSNCSTTLGLSVAESAKNALVKAYPNPTNGIVWLEGINEPIEILVLNAMGQILSKQSSVTHVDLSEFPKGIYFILTESIGDSFDRHIIKVMKD